MNRPFPSQGFVLLLVAGVLVGGDASAQFENVEEPRWLRLSFPQVSLRTEVEGLSEKVRAHGATSTHEYLTLTPALGASVKGSIYHPNLISFDVSGDGGLGWTTDSVKSPGFNQSRDEKQELLRYLAQVRFLPRKPYNASFFASQDHTFNNYDFFSTTTVDSLRYGGRLAWTTPTLSLGADAGYREETASSLIGISEIAETYLNFNGIQKRKKGRSSLNYRFTEFDNTLNLGTTHNSVNNSVGVSDSETFGSHNQITATTGASYGQSEFSNQRTETITADENITAKLRPKLDGFANANYSHNSLDPATTSSVQGITGVRHQLYASLTSTLDVHGAYSESSGGVSASNDRYGVGWREDYTKRLGTWGRLTMGTGVVADHEDHHASGLVVTIIDERHQLFLPSNSNYRPAYLNDPRVIVSTITVASPSGLPAQKDVDYQVIPSGELTEIRLIQGSLILHDGDNVRVNYQSESLYNASFDSLNGSAQIRLNVLNLFGVYGRLNWLDNNAPPGVLTQTLTDWVGGVDFTWRWFRAGAEYEDFDSNFSMHQDWRFFETFSYRPTDASTLGVEMSQVFYHYSDGRHETQYQFTSQYNTQLTSWLSGYAEAGYSFQDVVGTEQNLVAGRTGLNFTRGQLSIKAGYQYNYQLTTLGLSSEERDRNYFFVHLKRTF